MLQPVKKLPQCATFAIVAHDSAAARLVALQAHCVFSTYSSKCSRSVFCVTHKSPVFLLDKEYKGWFPGSYMPAASPNCFYFYLTQLVRAATTLPAVAYGVRKRLLYFPLRLPHRETGRSCNIGEAVNKYFLRRARHLIRCSHRLSGTR